MPASSVVLRMLLVWGRFLGSEWIIHFRDFFIEKLFPFGFAKIFILPESSFKKRSSEIESLKFFPSMIRTWYQKLSVFSSICSFLSWEAFPSLCSSLFLGMRKRMIESEKLIGKNNQPIYPQKWSTWSFIEFGILEDERICFFPSIRHVWSARGEKSIIKVPISFFFTFASALVIEESGSIESFSVRSLRFT